MQLECRCCPQIPNPLLRWALPKLLDILYPLFLRLNERFEETPFAPRWACVRACACCVLRVCARVCVCVLRVCACMRHVLSAARLAPRLSADERGFYASAQPVLRAFEAAAQGGAQRAGVGSAAGAGKAVGSGLSLPGPSCEPVSGGVVGTADTAAAVPAEVAEAAAAAATYDEWIQMADGSQLRASAVMRSGSLSHGAAVDALARSFESGGEARVFSLAGGATYGVTDSVALNVRASMAAASAQAFQLPGRDPRLEARLNRVAEGGGEDEGEGEGEVRPILLLQPTVT